VAHATGIGFVDPLGLKMRNFKKLQRGIKLRCKIRYSRFGLGFQGMKTPGS
jgi:hypothetical protein